jgi:uncharacterized protein YggE
MSRILSGAVVSILILTTGARAQQLAGADAAHPEVTASGRGEVQLTPTRAALSVTTITRSGSAAEAAAENARIVGATRRGLQNVGLSESELRAVGYGVSQNFDSKGKPDGFAARYTIRVETSQLQNIGRIVDAALSGGANEVSGVQFFAPNSDSSRRAAMALAVAAARQDAEAIARAAGGSLGRLISITSFGPGQSGMYLQSAVLTAGGMASAPTYLPPSDLTVVAQASGRWEFVPNR